MSEVECEGHESIVRVTNLDGSSVEISVQSSTTVGGLKRRLTENASVHYKDCVLLENGCLLRNRQRMGDLFGRGIYRLTAVPRSKKYRKTTTVEGMGEGLTSENPRGSEVSTPGGSECLDTLLPGYSLRPNPSPVKKKQVRECHESIGRSDDKASEKQYVDVYEKDKGGIMAESNQGGLFVSNGDLMNTVQLPDAFARLEWTYDAMWNIHAFSTGTVRGKCNMGFLREMLKNHNGSLEDIDGLAVLCPCMMVLVHLEGCPNIQTFGSCIKCNDACLLTLLDPWKARAEEIPAEFTGTCSTRFKDGKENPDEQGIAAQRKTIRTKKKRSVHTKKRIRQCWMLRKCLINWILSMYDPRYETRGLWLFGVPEDRFDVACCQKTTAMDLHDIISWCKPFNCDTVRRMCTLTQNHKMVKGTTAGTAPPLVLKKAPPCTARNLLAPEDLLHHIRTLEYYKDQIVFEKLIPPRKAKLVPLVDLNITNVLREHLVRDQGIENLYSHQAEAIDYVMHKGKDCIVSTSTASGKSFCYLIPIFESLLRDDNASALLIFPTKALSQDQLRNIRCMSRSILGALSEETVQIFDGDTSYEDREYIISRSKILLTNPDMLHCSILPFHTKFSNILRNLKIVSMDEAHMYRGVFGAHVSFVFRRLRRLCRFYGSKPKVILTTATVSNPKQHASALIGSDDVELVSLDGSPRQAKTFALWNPKILRSFSDVEKNKAGQEERKRRDVRSARQERNFPSLLGQSVKQNELWNKSVALGQNEYKIKSNIAKTAQMAIASTIGEMPEGSQSNSRNTVGNSNSQGINSWMPSRRQWREKITRLEANSAKQKRSSPIVEIAFLLSECVKHGLRTIAFCKTRKLAELVGTYTREIVATTSPELLHSISVYRAGYSPSDRREIERRIFNGELLGTCATNALELGVDIGGLDVTLHLGYQGTVASLWQQAGRAGRRDRQSLSIYVAFDGPLDQYFMSNPERLFDRDIEAAHIDISNYRISEAHCACAAKEIPLEYSVDDSIFGGDNLIKIVRSLIKNHQLSPDPSRPSHLMYSGKNSLPSRSITLRDIDQDKYTIVDDGGNVLEDIEARKVNFVCYDGAIYMSQGQTYIVKSVDYASKIARVSLTDVKYYTTTIDYTDVHLTGEQKMCGDISQATVGHATITTRWMGYARIWRGSGKVFDAVDLFVPDAVYETVAVCQRLPRICRHLIEEKGHEFRDSVHAAAHAIMNVLPLFVMCNPEDIATECDNKYDTRYKPERLLLFDRYPGGIGLCENAQPIFDKLIQSALDLVKSCSCDSEDGCPGCIQSTVCSEYNTVLSKQGAEIILQIASQNTS